MSESRVFVRFRKARKDTVLSLRVIRSYAGGCSTKIGFAYCRNSVAAFCVGEKLLGPTTTYRPPPRTKRSRVTIPLMRGTSARASLPTIDRRSTTSRCAPAESALSITLRRNAWTGSPPSPRS